MERTFDNQSQLPPLPLPKLKDTCCKYLESVKPFLSEEEYLETEFKVQLFQDGVGKELHEKLKELSLSSRNWVQDRWYDTYVDYRGSNPMVSNIAGGYQSLHDFDRPKLGSQFVRAAYWIHAMCTVYQNVVRQEVPLQLLGRQFPMDMSQYANFFCGSRIPGEKRDQQVHYIHLIPKPDGAMEVIAKIQHIVVLMKGRIFFVKVFDSKNVLLHPKSIQKQLEKIAAQCDELDEGDGVAALTMGTREKWFQAYKQLCILDRQNKVNINLINEAIFGFAFEDEETYTLQDSTEFGILGGKKNRWFDKSCQAVCSNTGIVITTEDHMHFDGNVGCDILQNCADILVKSKYNTDPGYEPQEPDEPIELRFTVDDTVRGYIQEAINLKEMMSSALGFIDQPIEDYGKNFGKQVRINPDTVIQMALQLAYYSIHRKVAPTYESATTRMFYNGRTETTRSCTNESKAWCEAMFNSNKSSTEKVSLLRKAIAKHDQLMMDACQGHGIDRHLLVLKKLSEEEGLPLPEIYKDKAYKLSGGDGNFVISSSLTGFTVLHGGMAPMVEDGYGVFYSINKERIQIVVSSWKTSQTTDYKKMYDAIVDSLHKIRELCQVSKL